MGNLSPKLMTLEAHLIRELPNFEKAIVQIAQDLRRHYAGLGDPNRPPGIYLLLGTTPQNPLPFAISRWLHNEPAREIDMGQYAAADSATRFRQHLMDLAHAGTPKVLILGDVDRSHPVVRVLLTDLFHNARFADLEGNVIDLTNSIIFMTTTLATDLLQTREIFDDPQQLDAVWKEVYRVFERYFIAPLSLIIPFFEDGMFA
jgi:ATP-dependent Clp protease ATP-binding subunit ClpA